MRTSIFAFSLAGVAAVASALWLTRPAASQLPSSLDGLAARAAALQRDIATLEDVNAIKKLQRIYGFYTDKQLWSEAADLFAADGEIEVGGRGVYVGPQRVREFLRLNGPESPQPKRLNDHMQLQPIVHVAPDGQTAQGRWHVFAQEAVHGEYAQWGLGVLENEYVKDGGVWKIRRHHFYTTMYTPYEAGWGKEAIPNPEPSAELPPDRPPTAAYEAYPKAFVVPFHYENPVTRPFERAGAEVDVGTATAATLDATLAALERRVGLLEDVVQLERLNSIYGYYLAHLQWDDLTGIFSPTGTIEIAMRGVYAGAASVRRNLNLYGQATDDQFGLQHNHMQFQPVITVAPDGQSALASAGGCRSVAAPAGGVAPAAAPAGPEPVRRWQVPAGGPAGVLLRAHQRSDAGGGGGGRGRARG
jgi:hypothetical protein